MIVEILGYFFPFIISNASEFCSERFGNLVKLWKTFPFESCSSDFFALACYLFFGPFGSRNFVSVAPRNRRQRKARHRASSPLSITRKILDLLRYLTQFKCHQSHD